MFPGATSIFLTNKTFITSNILFGSIIKRPVLCVLESAFDIRLKTNADYSNHSLSGEFLGMFFRERLGSRGSLMIVSFRVKEAEWRNVQNLTKSNKMWRSECTVSSQYRDCC